MKNNVGLLLTKRALINPEREAYVDSSSGLRLTFEELNIRCNRLANSLIQLGVKPGDRVSLALMNSAEFLEAYFAIAKIGGVVVPLNWRLVPDELEFILKDSGSETLIFGEEFVDVFQDLYDRGDKTDVKTWIQVSAKNTAAEFAKNVKRFTNPPLIFLPSNKHTRRESANYHGDSDNYQKFAHKNSIFSIRIL